MFLKSVFFHVPEQERMLHSGKLANLLLRKELAHVAGIDVDALCLLHHFIFGHGLPVDKVGRGRGVAFDHALEFLLSGRIPVQTDLDLRTRVGILSHQACKDENPPFTKKGCIEKYAFNN